MTLPRFASIIALSAYLVLARGVLAADNQAKLDKLNQREKQLLEKLDTVQQRERYIQTQLQEVRRRKDYLLNRQTVRQPGKPEGSPAPPPTP